MKNVTSLASYESIQHKMRFSLNGYHQCRMSRALTGPEQPAVSCNVMPQRMYRGRHYYCIYLLGLVAEVCLINCLCLNDWLIYQFVLKN